MNTDKVFDKYEVVSKETYEKNSSGLHEKKKTFYIKKNGRSIRKDYVFFSNPFTPFATALLITGFPMMLINGMFMLGVILLSLSAIGFITSYFYLGMMSYSSEGTATDQLRLLLLQKNSKYEKDNFENEGEVVVKEVRVKRD